MKSISVLLILFMIAGSSFAGCKHKTKGLTEQTVTYEVDGVPMKSYLVYDPAVKESKGTVLVIPEWWGLNDYAKMRARMLAGLGYVALATDMYGNGKTASDPAGAKELAMAVYENPHTGINRIEGAMNYLRTNKEIPVGKMAAIGYCFGGSMVLNAARAGLNLEGVVSFHGGLKGVPAKGEPKAAILVCHGTADASVPDEDVEQFKQEMNLVGAELIFKEYEGATHAFTNPDATEVGKKFNMPIRYDEKADKQSWRDMKQFLRDVFKDL